MSVLFWIDTTYNVLKIIENLNQNQEPLYDHVETVDESKGDCIRGIYLID